MQKIQLFVLVLITFAVIGCGPQGLDTQYVEGIITLDGEPLGGALITFHPVDREEGKTAAGNSDTSGRFTLTSDGGLPERGALEGEYVVTIRKVENQTVADPRANTPSMQSSRPTEYSVQVVITPRVYSSLGTTPLKATVQRGRNNLPFEMTSGR